MKTPFLGSSYVAQSTNLANDRCINLYPEMAPAQDGQAKDVAAFFMTPGLTLKFAVGVGPIRGMQVLKNAFPVQPVLYVVSGGQIYSVTLNYTVTLLGNIGTYGGPVSIINTGAQMTIFDGQNGYLVPGGYPLTGPLINGGGTQYAVGDIIYLLGEGGKQNATAVVTVTGVDSITGAVLMFQITQTGVFDPEPTSLIQASTSGSGSGFTLNNPTFGSYLGVYTLTLPFSNPLSACQQDTFGLVSEGGTYNIWQSNPNDLSIWDALNFGQASATPDEIVALFDLHEEVYVVKYAHTEVWINAGLSGFAFQRLTGVHIESGAAGSFGVCKSGEFLAFVSRSDTGQARIMAMDGYRPEPISTPAIEYAMATYPKLSDAIAFSYQIRGHVFVEITFPSGNTTWSWDSTTKEWHQEAAFLNGQFNRHWSNCYANFQNFPLVGDYRNGNVYLIDPDAPLDNGAQRKWLRSWRALAKPSFVPVTFSSLQIDMMTGINVPAGTNPQVMLRWTDDGGHNWSNEVFMAAGKTGETARRVMYRRLGSTRYNSGLDRVFELSSTDVFGIALIGADVAVS